MASFLYKSYKNAPFENGFTPDLALSLKTVYRKVIKIISIAFVSAKIMPDRNNLAMTLPMNFIRSETL